MTFRQNEIIKYEYTVHANTNEKEYQKTKKTNVLIHRLCT